MDMLFGDGQLLGNSDSYSFLLGYSRGYLSWEPEGTYHRTLSGKEVAFNVKWRGKIRCEIANVLDEYSQLRALLRCVNEGGTAGFTLYPQYSSAESKSYTVLLKSKIDPQWLSRVGGGQKLELEFETVDALTDVPIYSGNEIGEIWTTNTGVTITTHTGDTIVFDV